MANETKCKIEIQGIVLEQLSNTPWAESVAASEIEVSQGTPWDLQFVPMTGHGDRRNLEAALRTIRDGLREKYDIKD
jgi:hypothetical protein